MDAGRLDRRLTLRRGVKVKNAANESVWEFSDLATVWASRWDLSDAERIRAEQVGASITTRFQIRWSQQFADLDPKDQAVCEGRTFGIVAVKELGRRVGLEITATAMADS